jgi:hypothetical protein
VLEDPPKIFEEAGFSGTLNGLDVAEVVPKRLALTLELGSVLISFSLSVPGSLDVEPK